MSVASDIIFGGGFKGSNGPTQAQIDSIGKPVDGPFLPAAPPPTTIGPKQPSGNWWDQHVVQPITKWWSTSVQPDKYQQLANSDIAVAPNQSVDQVLKGISDYRAANGSSPGALASGLKSGLSLGLIHPNNVGELPLTPGEQGLNMVGQNLGGAALGAAGSAALATKAVQSTPVIGKAAATVSDFLKPGSSVVKNWVKSGIPSATVNIITGQNQLNNTGATIAQRAGNALQNLGFSYAFHLAHLPEDMQGAAAYAKAPAVEVKSPADLETATQELVQAGKYPVAQKDLGNGQLGIATHDTAGNPSLYKIQAAPEMRALGQDVKLPAEENAGITAAPEENLATRPISASKATGTGTPLREPQPTLREGSAGTATETTPGKEIPAASEGSSAKTAEVSGGSSEGRVQGKRGFVNNLATNRKVSPEIRNAAKSIDPSTYEKLSNKEGEAKAQALVSKNEGVAHQFVTDETTPWSAAKGHVGNVLINRYAESGNEEGLSQVIDSMDRQARAAGQGIQTLAIYSRLRPDNMLKVADLTAARHGQELSPEFRQQIVKQSAEIQKLPVGSPERTAATQALIQDIARNIKTTGREWIDNYRYQNMLSSPRPLEKIAYSGLLNTFVTRPATLFGQAITNFVKAGGMSMIGSPWERQVYFSDVPKYYKDVMLGMPTAAKAAMESFSSDRLGGAFEDQKEVGSAIEQARRSNIPVILRPFSALHGAAYSFSKSLIAGGEEARLLSHGVAPAEASSRANALADQLTLRSKPGGSTQHQAPLVRAVESIGNMVTHLSQQNNPLGLSTRLIAPFMRVSTNLAARMVEYSPLNLADIPLSKQGVKDAWNTDTFGKAAAGSIITMAGAMAALQGKVTLATPTDPTERNLFYAAGKKPYSVQVSIGGKDVYVPLTYFGPYALSFMLPQAFHDATSGANQSLDVGHQLVRGIENTAQFIVNSTPLPTIAQFFQMLNGDTTINPAKIVSGAAGQFVPLEELLRYTANVMDPVYRQTATTGMAAFTQPIESGIPGLSQNLPAYLNPDGTPQTRNASDALAPYSVGIGNPTYEDQFNQRADTLAANADAKAGNAQITKLMVDGNDTAARDLIAKLPAAQQESVLKASADAAAKVSNRKPDQTVDFFAAYGKASTARTAANKNVTDLVKAGKVQAAINAAAQYNQSVQQYMQPYIDKYGIPVGDSGKLMRALPIHLTSSSVKSRSKSAPVLSFAP